MCFQNRCSSRKRYDPTYQQEVTSHLWSSPLWHIIVCPDMPLGVCVLLSVCPAGLCTGPECRLPLAGPSGNPGAHQTKSQQSLGPSAQPTSTAPLWVCHAPHSATPEQSLLSLSGALSPAPPPPWSLSVLWWGHPHLGPHDLMVNLLGGKKTH